MNNFSEHKAMIYDCDEIPANDAVLVVVFAKIKWFCKATRRDRVLKVYKLYLNSGNTILGKLSF